MNIRRKVFSSISENDIISEIEERAFAEGYAQGYDAGDVARYEQEQDTRKKRRIGGHVMGAFGTAGLLDTGIGFLRGKVKEENMIQRLKQDPRYLRATKEAQEEAMGKLKEGIKLGKRINGGLALGAAALTAGGLYRINKAKNKKQSFEEWAAEEQEKKNNE